MAYIHCIITAFHPRHYLSLQFYRSKERVRAFLFVLRKISENLFQYYITSSVQHVLRDIIKIAS